LVCMYPPSFADAVGQLHALPVPSWCSAAGEAGAGRHRRRLDHPFLHARFD
jgi:hypothetical protein